MQEIFGFAERVFNPEGAVEMVSAFQRMGVAAGDLADPFRLMYLASEDTEELQKQVVKMTEKFTYFDEKTKEFKVFPNAKRDLREISNATGIQYEELVKMSTASQKLSMISKDFKLPGIDEESKQFIANVATYSKEKGGFTVKVSGEQKLVSTLNTNDLKQLKEAQAPVSLEDLAREQLDEATLATKTLQEIKAVLTATAAGSRAPADVREILRGAIVSGGSAVRESAGNVRGGIKGADKFYAETGQSLVDLMSGKDGVNKVAKALENGGASIQVGLKKMGDSFSKFNFEGISSKYISSGNKIADGASVAKKKLEEMFSTAKPVSSGGATKNTGVQQKNIQQTTNVSFNPLKVQGEVNFNMKSPDGSITKLTQSQIQQVLNSTEFQKTIQTMFKNMQTTGNYGNIPSNAGKY
jgi:hypothetical protein